MNAEPPVIPTPAMRRFAVFLKVAGIGFLLLLLQIPLVMTRGVLVERRSFQQKAMAEIQNTWGQSQLVTGPVLMVPYTVTRKVQRDVIADAVVRRVEETVATRGHGYFLPEALEVRVEAAPEIRYRGIYEAVVYSGRIRLSGTFVPKTTTLGVENAVWDWDHAILLLGVSDARRLRAAPHVILGGAKYTTEAQAGGNLGLGAAVRAPAPGTSASFDVVLELQGSGQLEIAPIGKRTVVEMKSGWPHPSFTGFQLPTVRQVDRDGFTAAWRMAHFGRGFPEAWVDGPASESAAIFKRIAEAALGVSFLQPLDGYGMVERAQKYGTLFFVQLFAVFFLFEITARLRIHPLQYAMVGAALCLFFLGFLALTEFWSIAAAYSVAAGACTLLVGLYAWSFLHTGLRTLVIGGGLAGTYGYLYFVLQSQDYALVAGTAALFAMLALVMYCTRRINWYGLDVSGTPNATAPGPV